MILPKIKFVKKQKTYHLFHLQGFAEKITNTLDCLASSETSFMKGANADINEELVFS